MSDILNEAQLADLPALYAVSQTALGAGLMPEEVLRKLAQYASEKGSCLVILETYRLRDDQQIPCIEYGINYPAYESLCQRLSPEDQIAAMLSELETVLATTKRESFPIVFDVWFEVPE